jgi:hypothetical protein
MFVERGRVAKLSEMALEPIAGEFWRREKVL